MIRIEVRREPLDGLNSADPERNGEGQRHFTEPDRKIRQTIAYMLEHLNQPLQVAKLAALANTPVNCWRAPR